MILLLIIYTIVTQANPSFIRSRNIVWKFSVVKESGCAGCRQIPNRLHVTTMHASALGKCGCLESGLIFWGPRECLFYLSTPEVKRILPVTYPQDCSGTESRLPGSQGGRNSPGTSHSWHRRCYPDSWYSGRRGQWNGIVPGRSSTPVIGHCSCRLSAETQELSRIHLPLRIVFYKTQNQTIISHISGIISHISGTDRW